MLSLDIDESRQEIKKQALLQNLHLKYWLMFSLLLCTPKVSVAQPCSQRLLPPQFGGVAHAIVNLEEAAKWKVYKKARIEERFQEALNPQSVYESYRLEMTEIEQGCLNLAKLIDLGRGIFLRNFTREEGYGHQLNNLPQKSRFQKGHFGGPDAGACVDCHWKGGFAGSGDRVDNTYAFGDGNDLSSAEARNPPALWGLGWVQALAMEMNNDLLKLKQKGMEQAKQSKQEQRIELKTKGIHFGILVISPEGHIDASELEGIDQDLIIKPFGWKGVFGTLREFVEVSAHKHLGMQSEYLVLSPYQDVILGSGPTKLDPDQDGVTRELTEAQVLSLVSFLATLDTPKVEIPTHGKFQRPIKTGKLEFIDTPAFIERWQKGITTFERIGCAECHRPFLKLSRPIFKTSWYRINSQKIQQAQNFEIDLGKESALPHPEYQHNYRSPRQDETNGKHKYSEEWLVPVFSDFKRHKMGSYLEEKYAERGVAKDVFLTRRLWGLRKTSPYLHHGGAMTFEEAIYAHSGEGSEAKEAAEQYITLNEDEKSSVRLFLSSLSRGPAIRIR